MSPLNQSPDSSVDADSASLTSEERDSSPVKNDSSAATSAACSPTSSSQLNTCCELCNSTFINPKVLPCLHTFCQDCLVRNQQSNNKIVCPHCQHECSLTSQGITDLIPDFAVKSVIGVIENDSKVYCTNCNNKTAHAIGRCTDCYHYLCSTCVMAHQLMRCFEGHRVMKLSSEPFRCETPEMLLTSSKALCSTDKIIPCPRHKMEALIYFCRTCNVPICVECTITDHSGNLHNWVHLSEEGPKQLKVLNGHIQEYKNKAAYIKNIMKTQENAFLLLKTQYLKAQNEINETFQFYKSLIEERKQELSKELEGVFSSKKLSLDLFLQRTAENTDKIFNACDFGEKLIKRASVVECLMFKKLIDSKFQGLSTFNIEDHIQAFFDFEFHSNFQAIQVGVKNTFGYVRSSGSDVHLETGKQPPIARPTSSALLNNVAGCINNSNYPNSLVLGNTLGNLSERELSNCIANTCSLFENNIMSARYSTSSPFGPFPTSIRTSANFSGTNAYEKWSSGPDMAQNYPLSPLSDHDEPLLDINTNMLPPPLPCKSPVKRQKMIYYCKFGEFGFLEGQFTEPSGVAVNAQNDIIVADTNNHRIQIFDKEGRFKFQFGEVGKRDGQFSYPNRVAVVKTSGDIIVTERSPTHQVQIYNQYGQFVRKFGSNILQYPRGVAVDHKGRIIIIECKVMRVVIFDQNGNVLKKFGCSKHVEFPNGVVVNEKEEIFISDNRAHCVKVFNYDGLFLRQIGSYGVINYPIGVGISPSGEILIADNHNNFNLTIFTQEGQLISALESKIKHAQCFDVALMDDGSVVLASKDYRLYIYRYVPIPPLAV